MGSVNMMGNTKTLNIIRGKDKIKCAPSHVMTVVSDQKEINHLIRVYVAALDFDENDKPTKMGTSKRSFCTECSSMLWNYHDEWPDVRPSSFHIVIGTGSELANA
ncbi:hypothetical protein CNBH3300 [Cryptococcus deneoformans B-3501A]|uniref:hypothetical protein n=1 Tax=Cryptococcus deneoformans (strain B-3501A) TaxID=283643 RepID=UPI000042FB22|nr:hypothetical protein CNBH3300 [Cryptococcus neoformans var. neoformans B-3501A]EAL19231.1 hypothetical protein CNBH3300 [Cryptococcus neoformans var. neoformans B-3501A]